MQQSDIKMKKILSLLFIINSIFSYSQSVPGCALPTFTSTSTQNKFVIYEGTCIAGSARTITVAQFISTYSLQGGGSVSDKTVTISGAGINVTTGTYPNFTITATEAQALSISNNTITISGTESTITIPTYVSDKTVTITTVGSLTVTGTYPNFTITAGASAGTIAGSGTVNRYSIFTNSVTLGNGFIYNSSDTTINTTGKVIINTAGTNTVDVSGLYIYNFNSNPSNNNYGLQTDVHGSSQYNVGYNSKINSSTGTNIGILSEVVCSNSVPGIGHQLNVLTNGSATGSIINLFTYTATAAVGIDILDIDLGGPGNQDLTAFRANLSSPGIYNRGLGINVSSATNNYGLVTNGFSGFGTYTPTATVHIEGTLRYADGSQANGALLTCDGNGNASWILQGTPIAVMSVVGTVDQIVTSGILNVTVSIAPTYPGQTSIVTTGTVTTGTWQGKITPPTVTTFTVATSATVTISSNTNSNIGNYTGTGAATAFSFSYSNIADGSTVGIDYYKTTATNCVITFPAGTVVSQSCNAIVSGVTATLVSTSSGEFEITVIRHGSVYKAYIAQDIN